MPVIDVGVVMEGANGSVTGQVIQINRLLPRDPCVHCRKMVSMRIVGQELMSDEEKKERKVQALKAKKEGGNPNGYWIDTPQLNTVGYLTTTAGGMVAGFCIGYVTGRFLMPKNRLEFNMGIMGTTIVERDEPLDSLCTCQKSVGCADQDSSAFLISAPSHWPKVVNYSDFNC